MNSEVSVAAEPVDLNEDVLMNVNKRRASAHSARGTADTAEPSLVELASQVAPADEKGAAGDSSASAELSQSADSPTRPTATATTTTAVSPTAVVPTPSQTTSPVVASAGTEPAPGQLSDRAEDARRILKAADSEAFYKSVAGLARAGHGELLKVMAYSPDQPCHQADVISVEPQPETTATLHLYGQAAYPKFDKHLVAAFQDPKFDHLWASVHHALVHGNANVALITNHGEIIDIALVLGALSIAMCEQPRSYGVLGESISLADLADRSNLLVSKMVATTEVFGVPTADVLSRFCRTYFSVPQTASRRRAKLDQDLARANNTLMRAALHERLDGGGQLLSMAASGSQDLKLAANLVRRLRTTWRHRRGVEPDDAPSLHLQPLYPGTMRLMLECRYVLPVAVSMNAARPVCEIGGLTRVASEDDCHRIMEWIAATHERETGVNTVYHRHEDDLLSQVRAFRRNP